MKNNSKSFYRLDNLEFKTYLDTIIQMAIQEDIGEGDYSTLACIEQNKKGKARMIAKSEGIIAGIALLKYVFHYVRVRSKFEVFKSDGDYVQAGEDILCIESDIYTLLKLERLVLNMAQRMSGIATKTNEYVNRIAAYKAKLLDTRKTSPCLRILEKWAVNIGGGGNHRMGLYDAIMLKDNHIDYCGGIINALESTYTYLQKEKLSLDIILEVRSLEDIEIVLNSSFNVARILLDNFTPDKVEKAVQRIGEKFKTECSGNITLDNIEEYAKCNVDFISVGDITHTVKSMDISLKVI